ncbi:hypothetical protein P4G95_09715 [Burkholderia vietnamiensis]|uniref:hypothetical protein n=1 Tax=Burkholderia vietnamiensis TaxID=60552 RepID=UPI0015942C9D|nr:hypothetical protein [Burkholderia vietnamiensis]WHU91147.1 hypothetical protein P4G95_09715 [Burkholderia vietnamiensis]
MSAPEERTDERTVTLVRMVARGLCRSDIESFIFDMGGRRVASAFWEPRRFEARVRLVVDDHSGAVRPVREEPVRIFVGEAVEQRVIRAPA